MKCLSLILAFALVSIANAAEVKVFDAPVSFGQNTVSASFAVNKDLGRAWVNVITGSSTTMTDPDRDDSSSYRMKVKGLSYDKAASAIVLDVDGQIVECAAVSSWGRSIFRRDVIKSTGCKLVTKIVRVNYDNGYEIEKRRHAQVFIVTE